MEPMDPPLDPPLLTIDNRINRMDWKQHNFWCPFRRAVTWYSVIGGNKE